MWCMDRMEKLEAVKLHVQLLPEIDEIMRLGISRRGDLRNLLLQMFAEVDMKAVTLPEMQFDHGIGNAKATTLNVPCSVHERLKRTAKKRGCSMNALVNGGIKALLEAKSAAR